MWNWVLTLITTLIQRIKIGHTFIVNVCLCSNWTSIDSINLDETGKKCPVQWIDKFKFCWEQEKANSSCCRHDFTCLTVILLSRSRPSSILWCSVLRRLLWKLKMVQMLQKIISTSLPLDRYYPLTNEMLKMGQLTNERPVLGSRDQPRPIRG